MTTTDEQAILGRLAQRVAAQLADRFPAGGPDWDTMEALLTALLLDAEVREEWGVRLSWPDGRRPDDDRFGFRDRVGVETYLAEMDEDMPLLRGTLIRRLHLTLPAEIVEEER